MPSLESILPHVIPFGLVLVRLAGVFMLAPMLPSSIIPMRYKALLVMMMSAAMYPFLPVKLLDPAGLDLAAIAPMIVSETMIGFSVGLLASIPIQAMEMSGVLMGQQVGFGLARVYNPEADIETDILGQLLVYIASGVFFATGGAEQMFLAMGSSFERVPIGGFTSSMLPLDLLTGIIGASFELAIRVAAPLTGITLLLVIVFGAIGKTMPQVNIMSVGFGIKIVIGLFVLLGAVYGIRAAVGDEVSRVLDEVWGWIEGLDVR